MKVLTVNDSKTIYCPPFYMYILRFKLCLAEPLVVWERMVIRAQRSREFSPRKVTQSQHHQY